MTPSIRRKLDALAERHEEVGRLLAEPDASADARRFRDLSREYAQLEPVTLKLRDFDAAQRALAAAEAMRDDALLENEPGMRDLAEEEVTSQRSALDTLDTELAVLLLPRDPRDDANLFLEVRAGTGGDEAAIFAGDLFRMYARYAETRRWQVEILSASPGEHGGYKEVIARIEGAGAYAHLKFESGTHRVQRVPATESQGRIHTSAATVAILPELDEIDEIELRDADLKIDTFRASGAGGQHVNKTDSAIRITHLPTGVVVECQDERSQHKNRARALSLLKARLLDAERAKQNAAQAEARRVQVGSGDRSQRIRTYNFPQGRITDHRINLTLYRLPEVMEGDMSELIETLRREQQADELKLIGMWPDGVSLGLVQPTTLDSRVRGNDVLVSSAKSAPHDFRPPTIVIPANAGIQRLCSDSRHTKHHEDPMTAATDFHPLNLAVLTVSDTRHAGNDTSGDYLAEALTATGHHLMARALLPDNIYALRALVSQWIADEAIDGILVTGGTGFTGRDSTPEALLPLLDKQMPGFGEMFRALSYDDIGTSTLQSRAFAGLANATFVFCLPGSTSACRMGWEKLIALQLDARTTPCNLAGLKPRLRER